jgi:hypothetical protein
MQHTFVVEPAYSQKLQGFVTIINHIIHTLTGAQSTTGAYYQSPCVSRTSRASRASHASRTYYAFPRNFTLGKYNQIQMQQAQQFHMTFKLLHVMYFKHE